MKSLTARFSVNHSKDKPKPLAWLISELDRDVSDEHLSHAERDNYLEQLKTYTRNVQDAAPLATRQGILLLSRHSFSHPTATAKTSRTALKSLANLLFLVPNTRQTFVDLGFSPRTADLLKSSTHEDQFLASRILFLLTYGTTLDFGPLFSSPHSLVKTINTNLASHAKAAGSSSTRKRVPSVGDAASPGPQIADAKALEAQEAMSSMALSEMLKLLFNLTHFYPEAKVEASKGLVHVLKLLQRLKVGSPPLQRPVLDMINALLNLELDPKLIFPAFDSKCNVDRLVLILDLALRQHPDSYLEEYAGGLLKVILLIFDMAPKSIRAHLRSVLLPSETDREKPLGQSDSLASRLLKLSASPNAVNVGKGVQELLFEVCDKDVGIFVRSIGYGFASGFLMRTGLEVPGNAFDTLGTSGRVEELGSDEEDGDEGGVKPVDVNPITGQRRDMEPEEEEDPRTEDEKIREAERLFVLFERLKATGVVNIENPVAKAAREGKLG